MSRPALLALGCLVALAPVRVFGEGTQSDKCQLRVAWKEKSERASLDVVDGQRPDLSRPFARVSAGNPGPVDVPCRPILLIWRGQSGGAAAEVIDASERPLQAVESPVSVTGGTLLAQLERTRSARDAPLGEMRVKGSDGKPLVRHGFVIFNGLPFGPEMELVAPRSFCLDSQARAKLNRVSAAVSLGATICQCSDLRITVDGEGVDTHLPIQLTVRRQVPPLSHDVAQVQAEKTIETVEPVLLRSLPPGDYVLETRVPSCGLVRDDTVTIPLEATKDHLLALRFLSVSGTATYGRDPAQGELSFSRRDANRRLVVSVPLAEAGSFRAMLPEAGRYAVQLRRTRGHSSGPSRFVDIEARSESKIDVLFDRTTLGIRVVDTGAVPIPSAQIDVSVRGEDGTASETVAFSDSNGWARLEDLQPGQVRLYGHKTGYRPLTNPIMFPLEKELPTERTLTLRRVRTARIIALDSSSNPMSGVDVLCTSSASLLQTTDEGRTDDAGTLEIDVEDRLPLKCGLATNRAGLAQITVQSEQPLTHRMTSITSSIAISFVDQSGRPMAGQVVILRIDGEFVLPDLLALQQAYWGGNIRSDAGGNLRLLGLSGGTIEVCRVEDQKSMLTALMGGEVERLASLTLAPGETRSIVVHLARK